MSDTVKTKSLPGTRDLDIQLQNPLICTLCLDILDEPLIFPCLDVFCVSCLRRLIRNKSRNQYVQCPLCRKWAQIKDVKNHFSTAEEEMDSHQRNQYRETHGGRRSTSPGRSLHQSQTPVSDGKRGSLPTNMEVVSRKSLTESAKNLPHKQHPLQEAVNQGPKSGLSLSAEVCQMCENPKKVTKHHCVQCQLSICADCKIGHNKIKPCESHSIKTLEEMKGIVKTNLSVEHQETDARTKAVKQLISEQKQLISTMDKQEGDLTKKIDAYISQVVVEINKHKTLLHKTVKDLNKSNRDTVNGNLKLYKSYEDELTARKKTLTDVETILSRSCHSAIDQMNKLKPCRTVDVVKKSASTVTRPTEPPTFNKPDNKWMTMFISGTTVTQKSDSEGKPADNKLRRESFALARRTSSILSMSDDESIHSAFSELREIETMLNKTKGGITERMVMFSRHDMAKREETELRKRRESDPISQKSYRNPETNEERLQLLPPVNDKGMRELGYYMQLQHHLSHARQEESVIKCRAYRVARSNNQIFYLGDSGLYLHEYPCTLRVMSDSHMRDMVWCEDGAVIACDNKNGGLLRLNKDLEQLGKFFSGAFCSVSLQGKCVYALNRKDANVHVIDYEQASEVKLIGLEGYTRGHEMDRIVLCHQKIYLSSFRNSKICIFNQEGKLQIQLAKSGNKAPGNFKNPILCGVDNDGNILVSDFENKRLQLYEASVGEWRILPGLNLHGCPSSAFYSHTHRELYITLWNKHMLTYKLPPQTVT